MTFSDGAQGLEEYTNGFVMYRLSRNLCADDFTFGLGGYRLHLFFPHGTGRRRLSLFPCVNSTHIALEIKSDAWRLMCIKIFQTAKVVKATRFARPGAVMTG